MVHTLAFGAALFATAAILAAPVSAFHQAANATADRVLTIASDLPSLKLSVLAKRDTLKVFGRTDFDITATPIVTLDANGQASVYYNGFANFVNDDATQSYYLVGGTAYYTTKSNIPGDTSESVICMPPEAVPPVQQLLEAFNNAVPTTMAPSSETDDCPTGYLWYANIFGGKYTICTQRASAAGFTISSANFVIDVVYLPVRIDIVAPTLTPSELEGCASTPQPTTLTTATLSLLSGEASPSWSDTIAHQETTWYGSCSCKGDHRRPCLFVHGLGRSGTNTLVSSLDYFGSEFTSHAPCCSSIKYASLNTVDNAWHSDVLRGSLCNMALQMSTQSSGNTIRDTIIVTHSMGNLILGSAIASGDCSLDPSSTWVGTSGPMKGSMASDYLQTTCDKYSFISFVAGLLGQCPPNTATKNLVYQGEEVASNVSALREKFTAAQDEYRANVKAVMCSSSNYGLSLTVDQAVYWAAGDLVKHKTSQHDGIVEFDSCRGGLPASQFGNHYSNKFYVTNLNHIDTTFRNGDAYWDTAKMPIQWFECLL